MQHEDDGTAIAFDDHLHAIDVSGLHVKASGSRRTSGRRTQRVRVRGSAAAARRELLSPAVRVSDVRPWACASVQESLRAISRLRVSFRLSSSILRNDSASHSSSVWGVPRGFPALPEADAAFALSVLELGGTSLVDLLMKHSDRKRGGCGPAKLLAAAAS